MENYMTTQFATGARLTRYLASSALALGVALVSSSVANALPPWDIGTYDRCTAQIPPNVYVGEYGEDAVHECCLKSGGQWHPTDKKCVAPPAETASKPGTRLPGELPTRILTPQPLPSQGPVIAHAPVGVG